MVLFIMLEFFMIRNITTKVKKYIEKVEKYVMFCAIWYHLYNLKNIKNTNGGVLLLVRLQALLQITLLHGCFSGFLNCTNGTNLRNASRMRLFDFLLDYLMLLSLFYVHFWCVSEWDKQHWREINNLVG